MEYSTSFVRELELTTTGQSLNLTQLYIGDVGCVVWDAALVLAYFLQSKHHFPNGSLKEKSVIELGSGTGAVGLVAAALGADVVITDLKSCLSLMNKNINDNSSLLKGTIEARILEWGESLAGFNSSIDYILMADVVYYEEVLEKLVTTVYNLSSVKTIIYMSYEVRTTGNKPMLEMKFFKLMSIYFDEVEIPFSELDDNYRSEDIRVIRFTLKKTGQTQ